jgi:hypothetical protein
MVAVGIAFVSGLLLGHGRGPAKAAEGATIVVSSSPAAPLPIVASGVAAPAAAPAATAPTAPSASGAPDSSAASPSAAAPAPTVASDASRGAPAKAALEPFNAKAARTNLSVAVARAQRCRDQTAPAGSVSAVVTFVPSGRVADVTVITPTYAGTHTGKCIVSKLKTAQVPPFSGDPESMKKTFTLR